MLKCAESPWRGALRRNSKRMQLLESSDTNALRESLDNDVAAERGDQASATNAKG